MVVVLLGLLLLVWLFSPGERKRLSAVGELEIGQDSTAVLRLLGPPIRCSGTEVEPLRPTLPEDLPPATVEALLRRMQQETVHRWVYPMGLGQSGTCNPEKRHTQVGLDREGRVLWMVPIVGKTPIQFPDHYLPSGPEAARATHAEHG